MRSARKGDKARGRVNMETREKTKPQVGFARTTRVFEFHVALGFLRVSIRCKNASCCRTKDSLCGWMVASLICLNMTAWCSPVWVMHVSSVPIWLCDGANESSVAQWLEHPISNMEGRRFESHLWLKFFYSVSIWCENVSCCRTSIRLKQK